MIDVIIPAYNVPDNILFRCLASIACQDIVEDVEVTIVDDASTEQNYKNDLQLIAEEYTNYYEESYTEKDIESLYGKEVLYTSFLVAFITESLTENITGMPEIPG